MFLHFGSSNCPLDGLLLTVFLDNDGAPVLAIYTLARAGPTKEKNLDLKSVETTR